MIFGSLESTDLDSLEFLMSKPSIIRSLLTLVQSRAGEIMIFAGSRDDRPSPPCRNSSFKADSSTARFDLRKS